MDLQKIIEEALAGVPSRVTERMDHVHGRPVLEREHRDIVMKRLQKDAAQYHSGPDRLHMGVAGFFNLEIVAVTRSDYVLLLDISDGQVAFSRELIEALKTCPTAAEFRKEFTKLKGYSASWLTDESAYAHLHEIAVKGHMAAAMIDIIGDDHRAKAMGQALQRAGIHTDTAYWSNIVATLMPRRVKRKQSTHYTSTTDDVFGHERNRLEPLEYGGSVGWNARRGGMENWNGNECHEGRPIRFEDLPPFEKMLRNISALGGDTGMHILTDLETYGAPLIMTDGPPRNLTRLAQQAEIEAAIEPTRSSLGWSSILQRLRAVPIGVQR